MCRVHMYSLCVCMHSRWCARARKRHQRSFMEFHFVSKLQVFYASLRYTICVQMDSRTVNSIEHEIKFYNIEDRIKIEEEEEEAEVEEK